MVAAAVGVGAAVAGVAGSAMSADAAGKAADQQSQAAQDANAVTQQQYEQNTANQQPYLNAGNTGINALMYGLGLGGSQNGQNVQTADQIRQELLAQYTSGANPNAGAAGTKVLKDGAQPIRWATTTSGNGDNGDVVQTPIYADDAYTTSDGGAGTVDEAGLNAAIQQRLQQQQQSQQSGLGPGQGSLLAGYKPPTDSVFNPYQDFVPSPDYVAPEAYKQAPDYNAPAFTAFTGADLASDPGYQFRLQQGNETLQNAQAAYGGLNSGRAVKDADAYNQGEAAQEFGDANARYNQNYQTNLTNYNTGYTADRQNYDTAYNANLANYNNTFATNTAKHLADYNLAYDKYMNDFSTGDAVKNQNYQTGSDAYYTNQGNQYNKLAALAGVGQTAASSLANVSNSYTAQTNNNLLAGANSQAAGAVGQSNAINRGLGATTNALNSYLYAQPKQSPVSSVGSNVGVYGGGNALPYLPNSYS